MRRQCTDKYFANNANIYSDKNNVIIKTVVMCYGRSIVNVMLGPLDEIV